MVLFFFVSKQDNSETTRQADIQYEAEENVKQTDTQEVSTESENIYQSISTENAKKLIAENVSNKDFIILDIRTEEEFNVANIANSINIDFYNNFENDINKLNKDRKYLIYCQSGNRSGQAMPIFQKLEFKEVYELENGFNTWQ